ncbi:MAG: dihydroxy-acid dehydratase, partial [Candidatus Ratteibacteria bacterium]|nr:dihydroxy-acid dehydratase [Candidatus Ratteibacteria bacterium]
MRSDNIKKGIEKAPHRALLKAVGLTDREINSPIIAIANSANEIVPGHIHLNRIAEAVKTGIRMAGGTPIEFSTIGVCDGIAMGHIGMKYSLVSREVIADSIEVMAQAHQFDGIVLIASCDKIVPGMLMALGRLNIPGILITGGPMLCGYLPTGETIDFISVSEGVGKLLKGEIDENQLKILEEEGCPGAGSCAGMFTANSISCLSEGLGFSLPGNGTIPAVSSKRIRLAKAAGMRVVELVQNDIKPSDIISMESFRNAIAVDMAIGASTNTVLHLPAIANEIGIKFDLELFDEISRKIPNICRLSPASSQHIQDLDRAGGIPAVMKELSKSGLIEKSCLTVSGKTIGEIIEKANVWDRNVIRDIKNPYLKEGGIAILKGTLAPDGAVIKQSAVKENLLKFTGKAVVFDSEEEAMKSLVEGKIKEGVV